MADIWSGYSGQAAHSQAITDQKAERYGDVQSGTAPTADPTGTTHASGYPTNAAADPADKALLNRAVIIIGIAVLVLILEGAIVFRNHNL